jgi:hypothetical protein
MKSARAIFQNLLLAAGGLAAAVLLAELALRAIGFSAPHFYTFDDVAGHRLLPGARGWFRGEGEAFIEINSDGLRDREHTLEKPPNTVRIAVLGDSFAEALQLPMEHAFWAVMERRLDSCRAFGGKRVEVINFGVSGYGTAEELLTLRERVWRYDPDIVLLAFLTANDVQDNSIRLRPGAHRPYFTLRGNEIALDASFRCDPSYRRKSGALWSIRLALLRRSRAFQLATRLVKRLSTPPGRTPTGIPGDEPGLEIAVYSEPTGDEWREAWSITEGILRELRDEVASRNARLVIATLSNGIQVHPDPESRKRFMDHFGLDELFYPDERIARCAEALGIEAVTLAPALQRYAETRGVFLHGFEGHPPGTGHWNAEGHRTAGALIADFLRRSE